MQAVFFLFETSLECVLTFYVHVTCDACVTDACFICLNHTSGIMIVQNQYCCAKGTESGDNNTNLIICKRHAVRASTLFRPVLSIYVLAICQPLIECVHAICRCCRENANKLIAFTCHCIIHVRNMYPCFVNSDEQPCFTKVYVHF